MRTVRLYTASDYAGLEAGAHEFYFGYEWGRSEDGEEEVWGFRYKRGGKEMTSLSYEAMAQLVKCPEQWDTQACLLLGIGMVLAAQEPA